MLCNYNFKFAPLERRPHGSSYTVYDVISHSYQKKNLYMYKTKRKRTCFLFFLLKNYLLMSTKVENFPSILKRFFFVFWLDWIHIAQLLFVFCFLNLHRSLLVKLHFCLVSRIPWHNLLNLEPCGQIKTNSIREDVKITNNGLTSNPRGIH